MGERFPCHERTWYGKFCYDHTAVPDLVSQNDTQINRASAVDLCVILAHEIRNCSVIIAKFPVPSSFMTGKSLSHNLVNQPSAGPSGSTVASNMSSSSQADCTTPI